MNNIQIWRNTALVWAVFLVSALLLGFVYYDGLSYMAEMWGKKEEYSHGYLIPVISLFFLWQKKNDLEKLPFAGSWAGVLILLSGIVLFVLGELSSLYIIVQSCCLG